MFSKNFRLTCLSVLFLSTTGLANLFGQSQTVAIITDLDSWISRCYNCYQMKDVGKKYIASSHINRNTTPRKTELFTLEYHGDKIALKADNGHYLKTCYGCGQNGMTVISIEPLAEGKVTEANLFKWTKLSNGKYTVQSGNGTYWTRYKPAPGAKNIIASYKKDYALGAAQFDFREYHSEVFEDTQRVFANFKNNSDWDFRFRYVYSAYNNASYKKSAWTVVPAGQSATNVGSDKSPANVSGEYYKVSSVEIQWKRMFDWVEYTGPTPLMSDKFNLKYTATGRIPGTPTF